MILRIVSARSKGCERADTIIFILTQLKTTFARKSGIFFLSLQVYVTFEVSQNYTDIEHNFYYAIVLLWCQQLLLSASSMKNEQVKIFVCV